MVGSRTTWQWRDLTAGQRDALVAECVMGLRQSDDVPGYRVVAGGIEVHRAAGDPMRWSPSTRMADALDVFLRLHRAGYTLRVRGPLQVGRPTRSLFPPPRCDDAPQLMPAALCLAALHAVGAAVRGAALVR